MRRLLRVLLFVALGLCALASSLYWARPAAAAFPSPDTACRNCHAGSEREVVFPSGEAVSIAVDLGQLDGSPHSSTAKTPIACTGCHTGKARYQYPHATNPAESSSDFRRAVAESCQGCHYPHTPFHNSGGDVNGDVKDESAAEGDADRGGAAAAESAPTCADCHGSHAIDRVENLLDSMPARCVACHTDQTEEWAAEFVRPRPGLGEGAAGYAGSMRCNGCHDDLYFSWQKTLHAQIIQDPSVRPDAVVGDFGLEDPDRTFTLGDVAYTVGSRFRQAYLTRNVSGTLEILPAQWLVGQAAAGEDGGEDGGEWIPFDPGTLYHAAGGQTREWLPSCGSCHVTGLDTKQSANDATGWGFTEFGVGCESCHGPAAEHAADPEAIKPYAKLDDQVCGACHSRGVSPEGHPFAATYRPGDSLPDHFIPASGEEAIWPDGSARLNHQQYMDWQVGNSMAESGEVFCVTCHAVHAPGDGPAQLRTEGNAGCTECHGEQAAIVRHTPFHAQAIQKRDFACADCHMPRMATGAPGVSNDNTFDKTFDLHSHTFRQPDPQATIDYGGFEAMVNACNNCHTGNGESPEWAAQTIAYVKAQRGPDANSFWGPGPTPTSPPPPTPIPSVGRPAELVREETGQWLRTTFFVVVGALGVLILFWIGWTIRSVRLRNA